MMTRHILFAGVTLLAAAAMGLSAQAATKLSDHSQWSAFVAEGNNGQKMCFVAAQPRKSDYSQSISSRGPIFFFVTTIPGMNIREEASTLIGYPFQEQSKVTVDIDGGSKFTMFTDNEHAWIEDPGQESGLVAAMRKGNSMIVQGTSRRGTKTSDTYSLSGITAALAAAAKACS